MKGLFIILAGLLLATPSFAEEPMKVGPQAIMTTSELMEKYGFSCPNDKTNFAIISFMNWAGGAKHMNSTSAGEIGITGNNGKR